MPVGFVRTYCQSGLGGFRFFVEGLGFSLESLQGWIRVSRARQEAAAAKALSADDFLENLLQEDQHDGGPEKDEGKVLSPATKGFRQDKRLKAEGQPTRGN